MKPPSPPSRFFPIALATLVFLPVSPAARAQGPALTARGTVAAAEARPGVGATTTAAPAPAAAATPEFTETEIMASEGADFESKSRVATFSGTVHVTDQRFELWCDKLTVYLNQPAGKGQDAAPPTPEPTPPAAGGKKDLAAMPSGGGIDRAVAEGNVIIVQRRAGEDGQPKVSTGRARRAEFKNKTGDMILSGRPTVQQDINEHVATAEETVMILGRDNTLKTNGPSRTVLRQRGNPTDKTPAPAAKPATGARTNPSRG